MLRFGSPIQQSMRSVTKLRKGVEVQEDYGESWYVSAIPLLTNSTLIRILSAGGVASGAYV